MGNVFSYVIGLGASVMMPVIFTVLGICIGIKFGQALKSDLKVGASVFGLLTLAMALVNRRRICK